MQVHPHCGDGVEFSVLSTDAATREVEVLHAAEYRVQQACHSATTQTLTPFARNPKSQ